MNSYIEDEYFYGINNQDSHLFDNFDKEIEGNEEKATDLQENQNDNDCNSHPVNKNNKDIKEEDNCCQKTDPETKNKEEQINLEKKESIIPKEEILKVENTEEDINKLKNDLTQPLNKKRGRTKAGNNESTHTRFSDDNLRRKVKHIVLQNTMNFINEKIREIYGNIGSGIFIKKLLIINQRQKTNATILFNKEFLNKTLGEIFSEDISSRYTNNRKDHNKILIEKLMEDKDEAKKNYFQKLFNITFVDCLEHFRGDKEIEELKGLISFKDLELEDIKKDKEYQETLNHYVYNYEIITSRKKERKS
jgi:hypothetical protein